MIYFLSTLFQQVELIKWHELCIEEAINFPALIQPIDNMSIIAGETLGYIK
jgi:hypothetical protein